MLCYAIMVDGIPVECTIERLLTNRLEVIKKKYPDKKVTYTVWVDGR